VVRNELTNLTFINGGRLKQVRCEVAIAEKEFALKRGHGDREDEDEKWR
jgi:hypothetical protein